MEAMLAHVIHGLVQYPDDVEIRTSPSRGRSTAPNFELRVAPEDFPRIVGRGGRTARALRILLEGSFIAQGGDDYDRPGLNIVDPEDDGQPV